MLGGCFDVRVVNVSEDDGGSAGGSGANTPALLIDDFEDGDLVPSSPLFRTWGCYPFNMQELAPINCAVLSPGYHSDYAYSIDFEIVDANDGKPNYPGVLLQSRTAPTLDVSPYNNIVFSAKLVPRDIPLPDPVSLLIQLTCGSVRQNEPSPGVFSIGSAIQPTSSWQTFSLALSSFIQFKWNKDQMPIDELACATLVDGLQFEYQPALADGNATAATLTIDNVYLQ
jgi:hypothetical protein